MSSKTQHTKQRDSAERNLPAATIGCCNLQGDYMPHVQRMKDEHKQLCVNMGKLGVFTSDTNSVFMSLPIAERDDMLAQLYSMENYHHYLGRRIERATK